MRLSTLAAAVSLPFLARAAPVKRETVVGPNDVLVFTFAHVLEQLETEFYRQALQKFTEQDFLTAGYTSAAVILEQIQTIAFDEAAHTIALEGAIKALGAQPLTTCKFDFSSVLTDVQTMITVARLVEHVGVGAYLGAAHLLSDGRLTTAAASILTIEARHSTILNSLNGGVAIPQAFDIPLSPPQVLGLAGPFISGCDLGVPANPPLSITTTGPVGPGTALAFDSPALSGLDQSKLFCNMIVGGATQAISLPFSQCIVPQGIVGPVAISITNDSQPLLASNIIDQSALTTVAGPTIAFIDFGVAQQQLSQLILSPSSPLNKDLSGSAAAGAAIPPSTDTTSTISPDQASSIAASATASSGDALATGSAGDAAPTDAPISVAGVGEPVATDSAGDAAAPTDSAGDAAASSTDAAAAAGPTDTTTPVNAAAAPGGAPVPVGAIGGEAVTADPAAAAVAAPADGAAAAADVAPVAVGASTNAAIAIPAQFNTAPPEPVGEMADGGNVVVLGWDEPAARH